MAGAGRPKGVKNRPGTQKPGRQVGLSLIKEMLTAPQIVALKEKVLLLFDKGEIVNLSEAAGKLGISPLKLQWWKQSDPDWSAEVDTAYQLRVDKLVEELLQPTIRVDAKGGDKMITMPYVVARIFLLKSLDPKRFREGYSLDLGNSKMAAVLEELRNLGKKAELPKVTEVKTKKEEPAVEGEFHLVLGNDTGNQSIPAEEDSGKD